MGTTEKISITIGRKELQRARTTAARRGLSLSMFITDAVRARLEEQERREAAEAVVATFLPEDRATADEQAALLERWGVALRGQPRRPARGVPSLRRRAAAR